ncbi:hypothetical protein AVM11_12805 [Sphingomonas melonis TY]|uniref:Uncharacterized protein n=1 Tax=Sphingomonas melonis TY TaxID=621456 RepID=A0A175Y7A4_9SPHN|nr:hypothetical protein BJP26_10900 [Sphingomonas melonis TY]KZB96573.1 hypothetical protein AVM11_12805 [Sphingomonas melonis TY]MBI0532881.1 hypothetical protein [Sphingomonas sp. TX0522]
MIAVFDTLAQEMLCVSDYVQRRFWRLTVPNARFDFDKKVTRRFAATGPVAERLAPVLPSRLLLPVRR